MGGSVALALIWGLGLISSINDNEGINLGKMLLFNWGNVFV